MNAEYFEKQRREMLAAVRAISAHMAAEAGKTALDERVLKAMTEVSTSGVLIRRLRKRRYRRAGECWLKWADR
jgi:hypothetical protein